MNITEWHYEAVINTERDDYIYHLCLEASNINN